MAAPHLLAWEWSYNSTLKLKLRYVLSQQAQVFVRKDDDVIPPYMYISNGVFYHVHNIKWNQNEFTLATNLEPDIC
jgi:hypothetical protein